MTLLAAFKTLLYSYSGQEDILIGSPTAGRSRVEVEGLIGCFINILPLKTTIYPEATFQQLLQQVRKTTLEAYENQDLPVEKLVEALKLRRSGNRMLIQAAFAFQNLPWTTLALPELTIKLMGSETQTSKLDLSLFIIEREEGLWTMFEYNTDLFEHTTISNMLLRFQKLLRDIVANSEQAISQLALAITSV